MSGTTHTPGPWQAQEWNCHAATTIISGDTNACCKDQFVVIAECSGNGRPSNECLADARLIAAAPELLAALRDFVLAVDGSFAQGAMTVSVDEPSAWLQQARAAIAKATLIGSHNNLVPSQALQPLAVGRPVGCAIGGDAPVVVEVYAIGSGVTPCGKRNDLALAQGAFELEANREVFVFDKRFTTKTERLVVAVEGYVAAVGQTVQAIDQQELAQFDDFIAHELSPDKTAILSLPQGMGKSTMGRPLAARLGHRLVVDDWRPELPLVKGALHLTSHDLHEVPA